MSFILHQYKSRVNLAKCHRRPSTSASEIVGAATPPLSVGARIHRALERRESKRRISMVVYSGGYYSVLRESVNNIDVSPNREHRVQGAKGATCRKQSHT